jgi:hypothetical protein
MSDRERWVVYPLLLLALGSSLRMKMIGTDHLRVEHELDAEQVRCRQLNLVNAEGRTLLAIGSNADGTYGVIESKRGALNIDGPVLAKAMRCEELAIVDRAGQRCITLDTLHTKTADGQAELQGGRIILFDAKNQPQVSIAESSVGGVVTVLGADRKSVVLGHATLNGGERVVGMFTVDADGKIGRVVGTKFGASDETKEKPKADSGMPKEEGGHPKAES